ncbi:hypothetical protein VOLCADRAFT_61856, partial [Volvox carteri f. nagariensis]
QVLGQFNLGFILARHGPDVFIVDQHAAAEKTTFERLQRSVVLTRQPLLVPMALPAGVLLPVDQLIIREHIDVFRRNGFDFVERLPDGRLLLLSSVPVSRATGQLGMEDVVELVGMLRSGEGAGGIRAMLASRACRSSVMVGRPLNRGEMRRLLDGLADLRQPWNCPHGRPTMRHVCVLPYQPGLPPA